MIRILRSLCQEPGGPSQRENMELVLARQFDFSEDKSLAELFVLVKHFTIKRNGDLPSLQTLTDMSDRKYGVGSKQSEFIQNELKRHRVYLGVDFVNLFEELLTDQTLQTAKGTAMTALTSIDSLRGKMEAEEVIESVMATTTKALVDAKSKLSVSKTKTEGRITSEERRDEKIAELKRSLTEPPKLGLMCGFEAFDLRTRGWHPGELILVAGYTGECKSTLCRNMSYHACTLFGANVLFFACEQTFDQTEDHFIAMHSAHQKWGRDSLDYSLLKNKILTPQDVAFAEQVYNDLVDNDEHGEIEIHQPGVKAFTWSEIVARSQVVDVDMRAKTGRGLDLIVLDYYEWIDWDGPRSREESDINQMVRASKQFALNFHGGDGVVFLSPWQMNNEGYDYAIKHDGEYLPKHLSTHNQSRRSADHIYSVYLGPEGSNYRRSAQLKVCNLKARDGDSFPPVLLQTELAAGRIHNSALSQVDENDGGDDGISLEDVARQNLEKVLEDL